MLKNALVLVLLAAVTLALAACASTSPNGLTGSRKAIFNDKHHVVGYQAQ